VGFGLRDSFELMKGAGLSSISQVRISGGGARSTVWRQILADIFGIELVTVNTSEGAAFGAALLAAAGCGAFVSAEEAVAAAVRITGRTAPGRQVAAYEEAYAVYRQLYPSLRGLFAKLSS
jgi:xylulokinase